MQTVRGGGRLKLRDADIPGVERSSKSFAWYISVKALDSWNGSGSDAMLSMSSGLKQASPPRGHLKC